MTASQASFRRLLQAARGTFASSSSTSKPLRCFPLKAHHVDTSLQTPNDFHVRLCDMIRNAKRRVYLASLYVGTGGSGAQETEFLNALASVDSSCVEIKILLDENRATRLVKQNDTKTSSAKAVQQSLQSHSSSSGLYLFPTLPEPRRSLLPSPLNEIAGVFHIKVCVCHNALLYFTVEINSQCRLLRLAGTVGICGGR